MREIIRQVTDPLGFHIQLAVLLAGEAVVVRIEGADEETAAEAIGRLARTW